MTTITLGKGTCPSVINLDFFISVIIFPRAVSLLSYNAHSSAGFCSVAALCQTIYLFYLVGSVVSDRLETGATVVQWRANNVALWC